MSVGLSFHCRTGSIWRIANLVCCSPGVTENQNLVRWMPSSTSSRSNSGTCCRKLSYSASVQKPITRSTPARLYQDRSNSTISPAVGRCATYRWKYHWCFSRSVGMSSATTCANRGFRCSMKRLIVLPLPAASRPSKTTTNRPPVSLTQYCSLSNSI